MSDKPVILVVDDTPENIHVLKGVLMGKYTIQAATSGEIALKVIEKKLPDLILLDIMMPDMDGYEVCRRLKAQTNTANIPVIFVSAMTDVDDEMKGFHVGGVDYITKPINSKIVQARVKTHIALANQQQECHKIVKSRTAELEESEHAAIQMLGEAGHYNDTDTGLHIWRMAAYSKTLASALNWSVEQQNILEKAAAMHDMGKIGIPDEILKAPRKLEPHEWEVMKTHSVLGYEILKKGTTKIFQMAADIALNHHEKWNGEGYPNAIKGEKIPESARIVAIADVFDALTMVRPYKKAWPIEQAVEAIQQDSGKHFDPKMVDAFMAILPEIESVKNSWS